MTSNFFLLIALVLIGVRIGLELAEIAEDTPLGLITSLSILLFAILGIVVG